MYHQEIYQVITQIRHELTLETNRNAKTLKNLLDKIPDSAILTEINNNTITFIETKEAEIQENE